MAVRAEKLSVMAATHGTTPTVRTNSVFEVVKSLKQHMQMGAADVCGPTAL